jgi:hypothetical protein
LLPAHLAEAGRLADRAAGFRVVVVIVRIAAMFALAQK